MPSAVSGTIIGKTFCLSAPFGRVPLRLSLGLDVASVLVLVAAPAYVGLPVVLSCAAFLGFIYALDKAFEVGQLIKQIKVIVFFAVASCVCVGLALMQVPMASLGAMLCAALAVLLYPQTVSDGLTVLRVDRIVRNRSTEHPVGVV